MCPNNVTSLDANGYLMSNGWTIALMTPPLGTEWRRLWNAKIGPIDRDQTHVARHVEQMPVVPDNLDKRRLVRINVKDCTLEIA